LVRKEAKKHGRQRYLEGIEDPRGLDAVIVEDVCTTGESSITAVRLSREAGMNVLGAICLVDREQGARANLERMGCPFDSIFTAGELLGAGGAGEA
ncbi:MAG: orotate phosphoribosyltransferase, partial [Acidobacteria bacterium]|nr:orotate phosphoribosyltransferase [Acidobacteriota bacterium]